METKVTVVKKRENENLPSIRSANNITYGGADMRKTSVRELLGHHRKYSVTVYMIGATLFNYQECFVCR